jgi:predicted molibdopterin-dependent oxidoreductase YjgC
MKNFEINNLKIDFIEGETVLAAAGKAGISIPALCYSPLTGCGGKCMVCAVKDKASGRYLPACITLCREGMCLDAESVEVMAFRRRAVELLLSEHRGDCEAPCRIVCPQQLDIPSFMAAIVAGQVDFDYDAKICSDCGGRCEKACRRGRLDRPVRIRALLNQLGEEKKMAAVPAPDRRYRHLFGKIDAALIKSLYPAAQLVADQNLLTVAQIEALRCLQCACAAADDCSLRRVATACEAKQHYFGSEKQTVPVLHLSEKIAFDSGKCIRCCRCVELGFRLKPGVGPVMTGRGGESTPAPPLGLDFAAAFAGHEREFVCECPTGALFEPGARRKKIKF